MSLFGFRFNSSHFTHTGVFSWVLSSGTHRKHFLRFCMYQYTVENFVAFMCLVYMRSKRTNPNYRNFYVSFANIFLRNQNEGGIFDLNLQGKDSSKELLDYAKEYYKKSYTDIELQEIDNAFAIIESSVTTNLKDSFDRFEASYHEKKFFKVGQYAKQMKKYSFVQNNPNFRYSQAHQLLKGGEFPADQILTKEFLK